MGSIENHSGELVDADKHGSKPMKGPKGRVKAFTGTQPTYTVATGDSHSNAAT